MGTVSLSEMSDPSAYESPNLEKFLAEQLTKGRLALVLGAGASFGFGLPKWDVLVDRVLDNTGCSPRLPGATNEALADEAWRACGKDEIRFAGAVRASLFQGYDARFETLIANPLMRALGAMATPSSRGHVSKIISFNFDDLLQTYLEYYGFVVHPVVEQPAWEARADTGVLYQHGRLPHDVSKPVSQIVFTRSHFDRIAIDVTNAWRRASIQILSSHTCLFIGLSGDDQNLRTMLMEVFPQHASKSMNHLYWGVRFSTNDHNTEAWKDVGVVQHTLRDHSEIPGFLLDICQRATTTWRDGTF